MTPPVGLRSIERMPPELVNDDHEITWFRADGLTRGKAQAAFASEWGVDFTDVRVTKTYFAPPSPECDECGAPATCGVEANWADGGPSFKEKVCEECQGVVVRREGELWARLAFAEPRTLAEVTPYDGWPVESVGRRAAGAVAYWHGEQR